MKEDKQIDMKTSGFFGVTGELKAALDNMRANFEYYLEIQKMLAKMRHDLYNGYIAEGFTKEQALELLKAEVSRKL